jgi:hypothetical protein
MMVQMFWDGILKSNHMLLDELFKWKEYTCELRAVKDHMLLWMLLEIEGVVVDLC